MGQCTFTITHEYVSSLNRYVGVPTDFIEGRTKFDGVCLGTLSISLRQRDRFDALTTLTRKLQELDVMNDDQHRVSYGNVSVLFPTQDGSIDMLITRSGLPVRHLEGVQQGPNYTLDGYTLDEHCFARVIAAQTFEQGREQDKGSVHYYAHAGVKPSSESPTHFRAYEFLREHGVIFIGHGHVGIPHLEELQERHDLPVTGTEYQCYGTEMLASEVRQILPDILKHDRQVGIITRHGFLAIGKTWAQVVAGATWIRDEGQKIGGKIGVPFNDYRYLAKIG